MEKTQLAINCTKQIKLVVICNRGDSVNSCFQALSLFFNFPGWNPGLSAYLWNNPKDH